MARYTLQAKRPHEKFFTEWCSTDDYEVIQKSIKIIESYGYQYQVKENEEMIQREQIQLNQLKSEIAREIFEGLRKNASLRFDGFKNTIIIPLNDFIEIQTKYTEGNSNDIQG